MLGGIGHAYLFYTSFETTTIWLATTGLEVRYSEQGRKSTAAEARSRIACLLMKNEDYRTPGY